MCVCCVNKVSTYLLTYLHQYYTFVYQGAPKYMYLPCPKCTGTPHLPKVHKSSLKLLHVVKSKTSQRSFSHFSCANQIILIYDRVCLSYYTLRRNMTKLTRCKAPGVVWRDTLVIRTCRCIVVRQSRQSCGYKNKRNPVDIVEILYGNLITIGLIPETETLTVHPGWSELRSGTTWTVDCEFGCCWCSDVEKLVLRFYEPTSYIIYLN